MSGLVERLRAKGQRFPAMGGGSIGTDANGVTTSTSYVTDDGYRLVNPDGPEAAALIEQLVEALERISKLPPHFAHSATDLHLTVRAIADTALSAARGEAGK